MGLDVETWACAVCGAITNLRINDYGWSRERIAEWCKMHEKWHADQEARIAVLEAAINPPA